MVSRVLIQRYDRGTITGGKKIVDRDQEGVHGHIRMRYQPISTRSVLPQDMVSIGHRI